MHCSITQSSELTHQIPRISLGDPAPLNILHSTKVKSRTPKYKEASYITGISARKKATPTYPGRSIETIVAKASPVSLLERDSWRLANWSKLHAKTPPPSSLPPNCTCRAAERIVGAQGN